MRRLTLALQTVYADLLDKLQDAELQSQTREVGNFVPKTVKGRVYWYHQRTPADGSQVQSYVGPDTPELQARVARQQNAVAEERARRDIVRALTRIGGHAVPPQVGRVLAALAARGVFRLRAVLVGTLAYQTYGPMLGVRMPGASLMTEDIDVAQFRGTSIAVGERLPPVLETLRLVEASFEPLTRPVHALPDAYIARGTARLKVEFLTPMRGPNEDAPAPLRALGTGATPLRFLDYLIYQDRKAAILHGAGVLVNVPDPARFAWHKLILSQRRAQPEKVPKDLMQAETLLEVLMIDRPDDVADMWAALAGRGRRQWQGLALRGLRQLRSRTVRDGIARLIGVTDAG
jgi:hypothetical protein